MTRNPILAPLPVEEWSDEARSRLPQYLRRPHLYLSGDNPLPMPQALGLFAHHVELGSAWMEFSNGLATEQAALDVRLRELAILRVAWQARSRYEWVQHIRIGKAAGITTEELYALPDGAAASVWSPLERAVLDATDEIVDSYRISAKTWDVLAEELTPQALLELTFVIGSYLCFAAVVASVGMKADPPSEHVDAPELPDDEG